MEVMNLGIAHIQNAIVINLNVIIYDAFQFHLNVINAMIVLIILMKNLVCVKMQHVLYGNLLVQIKNVLHLILFAMEEMVIILIISYIQKY
jgi:hypothetical protein